MKSPSLFPIILFCINLCLRGRCTKVHLTYWISQVHIVEVRDTLSFDYQHQY